MKITKRNGIRVDFDKSKIISAITRANEAIDKKNRITEDDIVSIANKIEDKVKGKRKLTVENVQEMIEFELMEIKAFEIAKAYIEYSYLHKMKRDRYEDFMEVIDDKLRAKHYNYYTGKVWGDARNYDACFNSDYIGLEKVEDIIEAFCQFPLKVFGIKLGAEGCVLTDFKETIYRKPYKGKPVVDTTGAGDCFMGGFLYAFSNGLSMEECGKFGSAVSAFGISAVGPSTAVPNYETVLQFIKDSEEGTDNGIQTKI